MIDATSALLGGGIIAALWWVTGNRPTTPEDERVARAFLSARLIVTWGVPERVALWVAGHFPCAFLTRE